MAILTGQSAILTGVGNGFGKAIALALADAGASLTLVARSCGVIDDIAAMVERNGCRAQTVAADVRDTRAAHRVHAAHVERFGAPSILVNSANLTNPYGPVGEVDAGEWWDTVAAHVLGSLNYMTVVIGGMRAAKRGCIINVCSLDGVTMRPNQSAYGVAKTAQIRLSEFAAQENRDSGVAVFAVHPGIAMSPTADAILKSTEARRWLPDFVAQVKQVHDSGGRIEDWDRCGERCVALASGRFNHLSGTFVNFHEFEPGPLT